MKRSLQFKRPFAAMRPTALVLALLMGGAMSAWAQASGELSDAERAKRDANKVFSFIKFHAVKPAAAPAPAPAPKPAPKPAPRPDTSAAAAAPAPVHMPEPCVVSRRLLTTGPTVPAAPCLRLAPVPVMPEETITEVRTRSRGR